MYVPVLIVQAIVCSLVLYYFREKENVKSNHNLISFRNNYLMIYLLNMMGDWLQGPYVYALYKYYGYDFNDIAHLFVAGFLSSAIFGTIVGSIADSLGRKKMSIVFSIVYSLSCLTKLNSNYWVLMLGRLLGGISTSLLFSVFESWMVNEHYKRGFNDQDLSVTFSWAFFGNGIVAILSGMVANFSADIFGFTAPFMVAIGFFLCSGLLVAFTWSENYGDKSNDLSLDALYKAFIVVRNNSNVFVTGMIQSLFESAMYTFVFMWTPALTEVTKSELPFGLIFASFMVSLMIGSIIFRVQSSKRDTEEILRMTLFVAYLSFALPIFFPSSEAALFFSFNVFEVCCGVYFPAIGVLRSKYIPEQIRSSVMSLFRIPLNLIVVVLLVKSHGLEHRWIFFICSVFMAICYYIQKFIVNEKDDLMSPINVE